MKQKKINQFFIVVSAGFLLAFTIFSIIASAGHFSGNKVQKDPESWFNAAYRCKAEKLVPMTSKTKGETVQELQNCLRFLHESFVPMDGNWDRETRKSAKWFYKHFLGKKSNGKKFDADAIERMRELAALAEPFLPVEAEIPAVEETQEEISEGSSGDLKSEVDRLIAESAHWKSYMRNRAKEEADFDLPDDWKQLGKKSQTEGFETFYYGALNYIEKAKQGLKKGDVEEAYRYAKLAEEARWLGFDGDFDNSKAAIERERQRAVDAEESKRAEKENRKMTEAFNKQQAQKLADLKKKLKPVCTDLDCMIAAGLECSPRNILLTTKEGGGGKGEGHAATVYTRLALKEKQGDTCNLSIKIEKVDIIDLSAAGEYRPLIGKEGLCPLALNMWWDLGVENDVSHTFVEIKEQGFSTWSMNNFKVNHPECSGTYFDPIVYY